jgi:uncharacterized coiled-coil DUF342 family protein
MPKNKKKICGKLPTIFYEKKDEDVHVEAVSEMSPIDSAIHIINCISATHQQGAEVMSEMGKLKDNLDKVKSEMDEMKVLMEAMQTEMSEMKTKVTRARNEIFGIHNSIGTISDMLGSLGNLAKVAVGSKRSED